MKNMKYGSILVYKSREIQTLLKGRFNTFFRANGSWACIQLHLNLLLRNCTGNMV